MKNSIVKRRRSNISKTRITNVLILMFLLYITHIARNSHTRRASEGTNEGVDQWVAYRIGDGIGQRADAPGCETYPSSLVCAYRRETDTENNITALLEVLSRFNASPNTLSPDTVAVHLRLGDGLCAQVDPQCRAETESAPNCWERDQDCWYDPDSMTKQYAYSKRWYAQVVSELQAMRAKNVVVFANKQHWTRTVDPRSNYDTDDKYIDSFVTFFRVAGFEVSVHQTATPDEDFVLLCSARTFVQGGGGFSALVASVIESRRGRVIVPAKGH